MTVWAGLLALGLGLGASVFLPVPQNLRTSFDAGQSPREALEDFASS